MRKRWKPDRVSDFALAAVTASGRNYPRSIVAVRLGAQCTHVRATYETRGIIRKLLISRERVERTMQVLIAKDVM